MIVAQDNSSPHILNTSSLPLHVICDAKTNRIHTQTNQGCTVRGSVKSSGLRTFTHFNEP